MEEREISFYLRRWYTSQLSVANWRGLANNLVLDMTKYVGMRHTGLNMPQIRQEMVGKANMGEYFNMWMAHETDVPLKDAFPAGWMGIGEDALELDCLYSYSRW